MRCINSTGRLPPVLERLSVTVALPVLVPELDPLLFPRPVSQVPWEASAYCGIASEVSVFSEVPVLLPSVSVVVVPVSVMSMETGFPAVLSDS